MFRAWLLTIRMIFWLFLRFYANELSLSSDNPARIRQFQFLKSWGAIIRLFFFSSLLVYVRDWFRLIQSMCTKTSIIRSLWLLRFLFLACFNFVFGVEVADSIVILWSTGLILWWFLIFNSVLWEWKLGSWWRLHRNYIFMRAFLELELSFRSISTKLTAFAISYEVLAWIALFHHLPGYRSDKIIDFVFKRIITLENPKGPELVFKMLLLLKCW